MQMLSIILMILGIAYIAINLIMFGTALAFMSVKDASTYLFFGTIVLIKEFILDSWIR